MAVRALLTVQYAVRALLTVQYALRALFTVQYAVRALLTVQYAVRALLTVQYAVRALLTVADPTPAILEFTCFVYICRHEKMAFTDCGSAYLRGFGTPGGIQCEGFTYIMRKV